jgi:hypothetical protein
LTTDSDSAGGKSAGAFLYQLKVACFAKAGRQGWAGEEDGTAINLPFPE